MYRWLAPFSAALLLALGGCSDDDLGLGNILAADVIYDAPQAAAAAGDEPTVIKAGWGRTEVYPGDTKMIAQEPVPWGPAVVVPYVAPPPPPGPTPYLLNTGDKLRVFVYGQPSLSRLY